MKAQIQKIWGSFINKPDIWFFYIFIITAPFSARKVLYFMALNGSFNEYTGIYIYLSDIFLFLTTISWLSIILCNNFYYLSNILFYSHNTATKCSTWNIRNKKLYKDVPRGIFLFLKKTYTLFIHNYLIIFPLVAVFFSFSSILWATNEKIAIFRSIKLSAFVLLYFFLYTKISYNKMFHVEHFIINSRQCKLKYFQQKNIPGELFASDNTYSNVPRGTFLKNTFLLIACGGFIHSFFAVIQFFLQHSLGFFWLKESIISQTMPGVAKIILGGNIYIRAYGLFPHPNILGGFLVFSVLSTIIYFKMFHVEHSSGKWICLYYIFLVFQTFGLFFTFSKSAILGLFIGLFYVYHTAYKNVPRGTSNLRNIIKMFHVEHFKRKFIILCGIFLLLLITAKPDLNTLLIKSLRERVLYMNVSRGTFLSDPILGIGAGQFVLNMANNYSLEYWQYQPVHNVFLLILNEYGILLLLGFIYFIYKLLHDSSLKCSTWNILKEKIKTNVPRGTFPVETYSKAMLFSFTFIMLFDHYPWDIQQGQIMLWVILGIVAGTARKKK